jgi:hypothetical protein
MSERNYLKGDLLWLIVSEISVHVQLTQLLDPCVVRQNIMARRMRWSKVAYLIVDRKRRTEKGQEIRYSFQGPIPTHRLPPTRLHLLLFTIL